ncbi:hypothetical protein FJ959_08120 [Mesorhizobium sp. B2-2-4]|uniref:hypothetical protein n=1 Tax=unclassified Mesorhizobium TaxID=325217 RepID=UPI00112C8B3E|nr:MULTISPECIES: hypothetical protein [unclassified Mesorhizobium]TPM61244.1 hypothetical protein FJ959_08120 [Mesorhizobium sp. B2-2-4]TPM70674.1 hypothetical protein FJ965_02590 [Mesorhizobium sp. B2-2-1]TPN70527.1 hypothetical protein FJ984_08570 [Mesorhizobium sp. B1-1-3]
MADDIHRLGIKLKFAYSVFGLFLGFTSIVVGGALALYGALGKTSFVAKMVGFETSLSDAPPGVVLFVVGLFMVRFTKFSVVEHLKTTEEVLKNSLPAPMEFAAVASPVAPAVTSSVPPEPPPAPPAPGPSRTGKSAKNITMRGGDVLTRTTEQRIAYKLRPEKPNAMIATGPKAAAAKPASKPTAAKPTLKPTAAAPKRAATKAASKSATPKGASKKGRARG